MYLWGVYEFIGNIVQRLCTAADIKFYVTVLSEAERQGFKSSTYVKGNKNCNLTSWVPGCEPGWACGVGENVVVDLKNKDEMPFRTSSCEPCCEGFFCPMGLTCMIRKFPFRLFKLIFNLYAYLFVQVVLIPNGC